MPKSVERQPGVVRQIPLSATSRFGTDHQLPPDFTFGGRIELIGGENFRGRIKIFAEEMSLSATDGEPSFWHLGEIEARETYPGEFLVRLADRTITFYPDDPVAFNYDAIPALNEAFAGFGALVRRSMAKRRRGSEEPAVLAGNRLLSAPELTVEVPERVPASDPWSDEKTPEADDDSTSVGEMGIAVAQRFRKQPRRSKARPKAEAPEEPKEHEHRFAHQDLGGGLQRRVCLDCGHLSLDLSEHDLEPIPEGAFHRRKMVYDD